jgi:hypothetical protein
MLVSMLVVTVFGPLIAPHGAATTSPDSLAARALRTGWAPTRSAATC